MPKFIDLSGNTFGRLTVIRRGENAKDRTTWVCRCECGTEKTIHGSSLKSGIVVSCGCYHRERVRNASRTHGMSQTKLYKTYYAMMARCHKEQHPSYPDYGARGISVCDEWRDDKTKFIRWALENGYKPELSIDRKDNNKGYSPENCRWTTMDVQAMNKRGLRMITINGETKNLSTWLKQNGIAYRNFYERIAAGWSEIDAASRPTRGKARNQDRAL